MIDRPMRYFGYLVAAAFLLFIVQVAAASDENVGVTEITPTTLVVSTSGGNVVSSVGPDGALLVGTPSASSTACISDIIGSRTKSPVRYVVIFPENSSHPEGDAGWQQRGAFVAMQENDLQRLGGGGIGTMKSLPVHFEQPGVERPRVAFSEVLKFDLNGDAIHVVHQKPGYSNADSIAHFHKANLVYLGEVFPGDGYPKVDAAQGGTLEGLLTTLDGWAGSSVRIVPARGEVTDGSAVKQYRDMIVAVREKIESMATAGKTEEQIIAANTTVQFDERWGHGRVKPEEFVREVYAAVKSNNAADQKK
ncbi:MAG TPA: hypothetical protein VFA90_02885 [Terriglobales bacterium]|nr:hypothetical protein [Terriglobales bacterium]